MKPKRTMTGYKWEKDSTPNVKLYAHRRDVDDKVFLEAWQTRIDHGRSKIMPVKEFVSIELTTKDLDEIREFCLIARTPHCYGDQDYKGDEECYVCPFSKGCAEATTRCMRVDPPECFGQKEDHNDSHCISVFGDPCKFIQDCQEETSPREVWRAKITVSLSEAQVKGEMKEGGAYDEISGNAFEIASKELPELAKNGEPHYSFSYLPKPQVGTALYEVWITEPREGE